MLLGAGPPQNTVQIDAADLNAVVANGGGGRSLLLVDKGGRVVGVWPEPPPPPTAAAGGEQPAATVLNGGKAYRVTSHGTVVSSDGLGSTYHVAEVQEVDEHGAAVPPAAEPSVSLDVTEVAGTFCAGVSPTRSSRRRRRGGAGAESRCGSSTASGSASGSADEGAAAAGRDARLLEATDFGLPEDIY